MHIGNGYLASEELKVSVANEEVIPSPPAELRWTRGYMCGKFEWMNDQDATVIINGKVRAFIRAGQGFAIGVGSQPIYSFVIENAGVTYNYLAEF